MSTRALILALLLAFGAAAQTHPLTGLVVGGNGLPIAGARITSGTANAVSAPDGTFHLDTAAAALSVTAPGYAPGGCDL